MGLFSNNNKLCPVCGSATPRLFPTKIDGTPICKDCAAKLDLPAGVIGGMTLEGLESYMNFYEANGELRMAFREEWSYKPESGAIRLDNTHKLFRLSSSASDLVFEAENITSFRITRDDGDLFFEGGEAGVKCYPMEIYPEARKLESAIRQFTVEKAKYEALAARAKARAEHGATDGTELPDEPKFEEDPPVDHFRIEISLDHPYWSTFASDIEAPSFDEDEPSVSDYVDEYRETEEGLRELAEHLMAFAFPDAPGLDETAEDEKAGEKTEEDAPAVPAAPTDNSLASEPIEALKKYKELMDMGVITEEEFTAKKKQLLGI